MFHSQRVVLVEGVFDYFAVVKHAPDVVAALTANVSIRLKQLIARYCTMAIALFDMDASGRRGALRLAGLPLPPELRKPEDVSLRTPPVPPFQVWVPTYSEHDPDDLRRAGKTAELQKLVAPHPFVQQRA
jgi:hypothetical protein